MKLNELEIEHLSKELGLLVLNKVLAKDLNINEAFVAVSQTMTTMCSISLPTNKFEKHLTNSEDLATRLALDVADEIKNNKLKLSEVVLAFDSALNYIIKELY